MQSRFKISLTISCLNYYRLHLLVLFLFIEKVKPLAILGGMAMSEFLARWSILEAKYENDAGLYK